MSDLWIIVTQLPLMLILSFVVGYEPVLYMGLALFMTVFWLFSEDPHLKAGSFNIFVFWEALFIGATFFHLMSGPVPIENSLSFSFAETVTSYVINFFR